MMSEVSRLTPSERRLLVSENERGQVFYVPAQSRMVGRLVVRGLLERDESAKSQYDGIRGAWMRTAIVQPKARQIIGRHAKPNCDNTR